MRFPRPCLDFYLDLGIARFHTALWREPIHNDSREFVLLFVEVWNFKVLEFRLYETGMSRRIRLSHGKDTFR